MATGPRYFVAFRRRREGRTDYHARHKLVVSDRPRMVVRRTNKHVICQIITAHMDGDRTHVSANSSELRKFGYEGSMSNTPAAYLTGMLLAVRALKSGKESAILDIGLHRASPGARVFAALKGAAEAGLDIPHNEEILPSDERCRGEHIAAYAPDRAGNLPANVAAVVDAIMGELN
ncbi:MAG TPA: 50S ribosomal protein L18 [Methanospirillum sp.]|nr:50S ribosomal protein L18 [Methanospirillum sp.]